MEFHSAQVSSFYLGFSNIFSAQKLCCMCYLVSPGVSHTLKTKVQKIHTTHTTKLQMESVVCLMEIWKYIDLIFYPQQQTNRKRH